MSAISSTSGALAASSGSTRQLGSPLVVILASLLLGLILANSVPLLDPDEGRNAEIAREMAVSGDVVIPHLAGMPYLDKPPALFWAAALAIRVAGPTRWAPRLPAIAAAVLTLLALSALARRIGGETLAWRSAALLASAPLFAVIGAYVIFDMPLALCVTLVWTLLARELAEGESSRRRAAMFVGLTLGVLIKGPVMLAWALGGSVATALVMRSRSPVRWLGWWPGWVMVFGVAGGWFALATARYPEYPRYAFLEESLERMTRRSFDRNQPWWFVPVTLIGGTLPWSLVTPWWRTRNARDEGAPRVAALAAARAVSLGFVLFALVFFSLSRSKLVTYLVPALPPLALLAAMAWGPALASGRRGGRVGFAACLVTLPLALILGSSRLRAEAEQRSSEPLARAIAAALTAAAGQERPVAAGPAVRYERCYSAGADYLLNRTSAIVSTKADQTTSVYQARYRDGLRARGLWKPVDDVGQAAAARVIVRPVPDDVELPAHATPIFRDRRFTAYRIEPR